MLASTFSRDARRAGVPVEVWVAVGSLRRFAPDIGDVTLVAQAPASHHPDAIASIAAIPRVTAVAAQSDSRITVHTERGVIGVLLVAPEHAGGFVAWHTGSRQHTAQLQQRAARMGLDYVDGLLVAHGHAMAVPTEVDFYAALELPLIPPEVREGVGEIEAAENGAFPELLDALHIRGDLHMHSSWSDGRDSIEDMVRASRQLGYQYIAITDHSQRAWSSRQLAAYEIPRQRAEIEALRAQYPDIEILHGVEVDIMPDGSLDFPDEVLAGFDIVLASLHDHAGQSPTRLTERYLRAVSHRLVNVITHPANRSPAYSPGYDVDFDRLFEAAATTGTALEIDGAPGHLDMDGTLARRAIAAGATLVVDSDCHRADALARQMRFGVGTARRGWVEPRHVLNTRDVDEVRSFVARKRTRG